MFTCLVVPLVASSCSCRCTLGTQGTPMARIWRPCKSWSGRQRELMACTCLSRFLTNAQGLKTRMKMIITSTIVIFGVLIWILRFNIWDHMPCSYVQLQWVPSPAGRFGSSSSGARCLSKMLDMMKKRSSLHTAPAHAGYAHGYWMYCVASCQQARVGKMAAENTRASMLRKGKSETDAPAYRFRKTPHCASLHNGQHWERKYVAPQLPCQELSWNAPA